jgi:hypothetical protein
MFGRKPKKGSEVAGVQFPSGPLRASDAFAGAHRVALVHDAEARLYLIVCDDVAPNGRGSAWRFQYLMPGLHSEGVIIVGARDSARAEVTVQVTRYPEPGSPEEFMATISREAAVSNEERWRLRLSMLTGLPTRFVEPGLAIAMMQLQGAVLFNGGPLRLKARMLPDGMAVWEAANLVGIYRVPLAA